MNNILAWLSAIFLMLFALGVTILLLRGLLRNRRSFKSLPFQPVIDPNPPALVVLTKPARAVASLAIIYGFCHILAVGVWIVLDIRLLKVPAVLSVVVYIIMTAVITSSGGAMLMRRAAMGRRVIS